jgi:hypothetical protein
LTWPPAEGAARAFRKQCHTTQSVDRALTARRAGCCRSVWLNREALAFAAGKPGEDAPLDPQASNPVPSKCQRRRGEFVAPDPTSQAEMPRQAGGFCIPARDTGACGGWHPGPAGFGIQSLPVREVRERQVRLRNGTRAGTEAAPCCRFAVSGIKSIIGPEMPSRRRENET